MNTITTIKKMIITTALIAGGMFVSGCSPTTSAFDTHSYEALKANSSTLNRGVVFKIAPDDEYQKLLAAYQGDSEKFKKATGLTLEEARDKQYVFIDNWKAPGAVGRHVVLAHHHWNLDKGDIVDYYVGSNSDDDLRTKNKSVKKAYGLGWALGIWYVATIDTAEGLKPSEILGVVCRDNDDDCTYNSSPETTIGIGRKLASPADYRGVEAESQQPMRSQQYTIANALGISYCTECTDEEREQWVE